MGRVTHQIGRLILDENKHKKSDSNVFVRIAAVNRLPILVTPNDPLSHKGDHNTEIPLHTPTSRFLLSVIGDHYGLYLLYITICNFILGLLTE